MERSALQFTQAARDALRELAHRRRAARDRLLIAACALVIIDVVFVLFAGPPLGVFNLAWQPLFELDAVMLGALVLLCAFGRTSPVACAALGLISYWAFQMFALAVDALPVEQFTLELMFKMCASGLVLRSITTAVLAGEQLRAQGIQLDAPIELPAAHVVER